MIEIVRKGEDMPSLPHKADHREPESFSGKLSGDVTAKRRRTHINLPVLAVLSSAFIFGAGGSMLFSTVPPLMRHHGATEFQTGALISCGALSLFISAPFWGRKSDIWGRKPVILLGLIAYGLSFLVFGLLSDFASAFGLIGLPLVLTLVVTRFTLLAASAGVMPAAQAFVAISASPTVRISNLALFGAVVGAGYTLGPIMGGLLAQSGLTKPFYVIAVTAFIAAAAIALALPMAPRVVGPANRKTCSAFDPRIRLTLLVGLLIYIILACTQQMLAFIVLDRMQLSPERAAQVAGYGLSMAAVTTIGCQAGLIPLLKPSAKWLMMVGLTACGAAMLVIPSMSSLPIYLATFGIFGAGAGLAATGFLAASVSALDASESGAAAGLATATQAFGFVIGPLLGTMLYRYGSGIPFYVCAALCLCGCAIVLRRL